MPGKRSRAKTASRPRSLLARTLGAVWRHPLLAGAALAAAGWLLGGDRAGRLPRTRRVAGQSIPVNESPAEGAPSHG
jgi:hypothetical protein